MKTFTYNIHIIMVTKNDDNKWYPSRKVDQFVVAIFICTYPRQKGCKVHTSG